MFAEIAEQLLYLLVAADIAAESQLAAEFPGHFLHAVPHPFPLVCEGKLGAFAPHHFGDAVSDGAIAQQSGDQHAFAGEKSHWYSLSMDLRLWNYNLSFNQRRQG